MFLVFHFFVCYQQPFFHQCHDKPHYWPLACFFTLNGWCERYDTFSQLVLQMETAWGYFSPFPHEWACQFILASGLLGFMWLRLMTRMMTKQNAFYFDSNLVLISLFLYFPFIFLLFSSCFIDFILQVAFGLKRTCNFCILLSLTWWLQNCWIT